MNLKMPVFFDTDCLCSFSWVNRLDIIVELFGNNVCIPSMVFKEIERLRYTKSIFVYQNIKRKIETGEFKLVKLDPLDTLYSEFLELVDPAKEKPVGNGEAAAIVLAKQYNGTLASNNLKDVLPHIQPDQPPLITTETILYLAYQRKLISFQEGQQILDEMKLRKRKLSTYSFFELLDKYKEVE
ncbi:putative nucleic acid-binding protein [Caldicellulosiruptor bescii]|uniref:PIN domain-containing protein n=2 Tax=Caldicellulosiruptor bescii TaxID=31899 RepID=B9MNK2_CALBD|nr:hypothetical protein [Caldicellulosiruptor bescii]ACM61533.1 conserved hypothetical protein [Caldicellulosiruptor bescii DSM 6725]PBC88654.1 putative nucleic acid-binding protein [Caldicellulosiruptor bescii]PBC91865.1 putative nucleic acid-binding protein [Caldicellulosiruptor bescii]PBD02724.1 putative nucleic acid-binding protein [Caldicellulosiruptor bescii]PBD07659.1 putative nucleic acid-binding protein [Caldicellulosiruptor bescii]